MGLQNTITSSNGTIGKFDGLTITGGNQGVSLQNGTQIGFSKCIIRDNGQRGINIFGCGGNVRNCIIRDNGGEGIYINNGGLATTGSLIYNNDEGVAFSNGGAVIRNCTIVNNTSYGVLKADETYSSSAVISNSIVCNNGEDLSSGCNATYSWLTANGDPYFLPDDPLFHIDIQSPCVNTGNPRVIYSGVDIDGQTNIIGRCVDIGADEVAFNAPSQMATGGSLTRPTETTCLRFRWNYQWHIQRQRPLLG